MIRPSETSGAHLNSIWLEGTVVAEPREGIYPKGGPAWLFRVRSPGVRDPGPPGEFLVEASNSALDGTRVCRGRGVRIIGRLEQHRWRDPLGRVRSEVKIVGELVEPVSLRS